MKRALEREERVYYFDEKGRKIKGAPPWVSANLEQIRGLVREVNVLRAALDEVRSMAKSGMGEWASVRPPYLPAEMEVLHGIIAACDEAVQKTQAAHGNLSKIK